MPLTDRQKTKLRRSRKDLRALSVKKTALRDLADEPIKERFYEADIQKTIKRDDKAFEVDRVIKTRKRNGKIQYLVSWKGYPSKFDSWVDDLVAR